jgi:hypothetical protein
MDDAAVAVALDEEAEGAEDDEDEAIGWNMKR